MSNLYMITFEDLPDVVFEQDLNDEQALQTARFIAARKVLDGQSGGAAYVSCVARNVEFIDMVNAAEVVSDKRPWTLGIPTAIQKYDTRMAKYVAEHAGCRPDHRNCLVKEATA